jgi:hypothetical protein
MNELQDELLSELSSDIDAANIAVLQEDARVFLQLSTKFPTSIFGIAWEKVPEQRFISSPDPKPSIEEYLPAIKGFLARFAEQAHLEAGTPMYVIGDGVTDVAFKIGFGVFLKYAYQFFRIPQHTYLVTQDYSWCFCFTFEGDMYFGKAKV